MIGFFKNFYLNKKFFLALAITILVFVISFVFPALLLPAQFLLILVMILLLIDIFLLFRKKNHLTIQRNTPRVLSLGDANIIGIELKNLYSSVLFVEIFDETPIQLQMRNFSISLMLKSFEYKELNYEIAPKCRGEYHFGKMHVFMKTRLGFAMKRESFDLEKMIMVFPSVIQMKKMEIKALQSINTMTGVKKIRRIGHSYEYEQIRSYVMGDDPRSVNWKASGRVGDLMVNQFEDEKSQQVYCVLDKSRAMRMPFNGLSLLDYSINTSLVISNIVLKKYDKVGLFSFSDKIGSILKADNKKTQLNSIMKLLYNEKEHFLEADYELMFSAIRNFIRVRSLLFLFTNFESMNALERVLPILQKLNKQHLLVVMMFENSEISVFAQDTNDSIESIYQQTIAKKMLADKNLIVQELKKHKIQTILSKPEDLSINTINKYLELKARGLI